MTAVARACGLLLSWVALITAQSTGSMVAVEISPVVHQSTPFSALLRLPASLPLKKGGVEVAAFVLDGKREEIPLVTKKFVVSSQGEFLLEHELGGLLIGCAGHCCAFLKSNPLFLRWLLAVRYRNSLVLDIIAAAAQQQHLRRAEALSLTPALTRRCCCCLVLPWLSSSTVESRQQWWPGAMFWSTAYVLR